MFRKVSTFLNKHESTVSAYLSVTSSPEWCARKPNTSPRCTDKSIPSTAIKLPNLLCRPLTEIKFSICHWLVFFVDIEATGEYPGTPPSLKRDATKIRKWLLGRLPEAAQFSTISMRRQLLSRLRCGEKVSPLPRTRGCSFAEGVFALSCVALRNSV